MADRIMVRDIKNSGGGFWKGYEKDEDILVKVDATVREFPKGSLLFELCKESRSASSATR